MINSPLLKRQILRLVQGARTYHELCDQQWVLAPAEVAIAPPAIYLAGELEKVTEVPENTSYKLEMKRVLGGERHHAATIAYQLSDVDIRQGYIYKDSMKLCLTPDQESLWISSQIELIDNAALACTWCGVRYFGHWLDDDLPLTLAAQQIAPAITTDSTSTQQKEEYKQLFDTHVRPVQQATCKQLTIIDDIGQNRFKRDRLHIMRSKLEPFASAAPPPGVMFLRGKTGVQRLLVNEDEVAAFLQERGFLCLTAEKLSAPELVRQTWGAKIIVGVEGSQLTHGLFTMAAGGVMLTLQPPYRFNNVLKDYIDCLDLDIRYGFVVGQPVTGGFEISLANLAKVLDKIDTALV